MTFLLPLPENVGVSDPFRRQGIETKVSFIPQFLPVLLPHRRISQNKFDEAIPVLQGSCNSVTKIPYCLGSCYSEQTFDHYLYDIVISPRAWSIYGCTTKHHSITSNRIVSGVLNTLTLLHSYGGFGGYSTHHSSVVAGQIAAVREALPRDSQAVEKKCYVFPRTERNRCLQR